MNMHLIVKIANKCKGGFPLKPGVMLYRKGNPCYKLKKYQLRRFKLIAKLCRIQKKCLINVKIIDFFKRAKNK